MEKLGERETRERVKKHNGESGGNGEEGRNSERNDWTEVRYGRETRREANVYVSNLPLGFTSTKLWIAFSKMEGLTDAYVPSKRNEMGKRFGFLRFRKVQNEESLVQKINNTTIEGLRVQANISKYNRDAKKDFNKKEQNDARDRTRHSRYNNMEERSHIQFNSARMGDRSYCDAVKGRVGEHLPEYRKAINLGNKEVTNLTKLVGRALIGETKNLDVINKLPELLQKVGPGNMVIRYMGGLKVLLSFESTADAKNYLENKEQGWGSLFNQMIQWDGKEETRERVAWVRLKGIPIQSWCSKTSELIGEKIGKVIRGSMADEDDGDFTEDRLALLVNKLDKIYEKVTLWHMGRNFEILVEEEERSWKPEFVSINRKMAWKIAGGFPMASPGDIIGKAKSHCGRGIGGAGNMEAKKDYEDLHEKYTNHNTKVSEKIASVGPTGNTNAGLNKGPPFYHEGPRFNQDSNTNSPTGLGPISPNNYSKMDCSPSPPKRSIGPNKRKRTENSQEKKTNTLSGGNLKPSKEIIKKAAGRVGRIKFDLSKKLRKKGKKTGDLKFVEDEIESWANENEKTKQNGEEDDWISTQSNLEETEILDINSHLSEEEIVKETLDVLGMGEELGINLQGFENKVGELIMEQEKEKVFQ